jgi:Ca2+-binding EF-hand superfamily protein
MLAFGIDVKKEDIRKIYHDLGKEVSDSVNFAEFVQIMSVRLVSDKLGYF